MASAPTSQMHTAEGDYGMFAAVFDESTLLKLIQGTHNAPAADCNNVDVEPILKIIQDVLKCAAPSNEGKPLEDNTSEAVEIEETLASTIQKVSSEITCKCSWGDVHTTTMTLLRMLSSYAWGAKVAIALGALAIAYGNFQQMVQPFRYESTDPLTKSVAKLKHLPKDLKNESLKLEPPFKKLIDTMLNVTSTILKFKELYLEYISPEQRPLSDAITQISLAAYGTIRSVVACVSQIANLIGNSYEHTTSTTDDASWLSKLCDEESRLRELLNDHLQFCKQHINDKIQLEVYGKLVLEFKSPQRDNLKILRHLLYKKDDKESKPLYKDSTKKWVHVDEVFQGKTVLLLISDLKPFDEELDIMNRIYDKDSKSKLDNFQYEIVWVPVIDKSILNWKEDFEKIQRKMTCWYILHDPEVLEPAVIRYIKEEWNFSNETILVVLDAKGNVVCKNAFNRYLIWGNKAISSIANKDEEALWSDENQGPIDLFFNGIDLEFDKWIKEGKYICVYGGGDPQKINEFAKKAFDAADLLNIKLKIIYAGKSNETKKTRETTEAIKAVRGVNVIDNMRQFWVRLKCMLYSKSQLGKNVKNDLIMPHVMDILSFDGSDQVWAMWFVSDDKTRAQGGEMTSVKGDAVLNSVTNVKEWKESAKNGRVIPALKGYVKNNSKPEPHCNKIMVPGDKGGIPKIVHCGCGNEMKMYFTYCCCTD